MELSEIPLSPLHAPEERKHVILKLADHLGPAERLIFNSVLASPVETPSQAEIDGLSRGAASDAVVRECIKMAGLCKHGPMKWVYFKGIGSVFVLYRPDLVTDLWIDVFPGVGENMRVEYLRTVVLKVFPDATPTAQEEMN